MRIAIFSDNFYPEISGISDSVISLAKELAKRGHFINFYVPRYSPKDYRKVGAQGSEPDLGPNVKIVRFSSLHVSAGTGQGRAVIPTFWRWLAVKKFRPDVIHTQLFFGVGLEALIASRKLKVPLVGTNHTAIRAFLNYFSIKTGWFQNGIIKYMNWYYEKCDLVTTPSRTTFEEMKADGFKKDALVISNPVDTETFHPMMNKNALKKKFAVGEFTAIHAGRLGAERNVDVILKALPLVKKEIPKAELAIAGKGAAEENLRGLAKSLGINQSLKFLGFLDKPALAEAYNASKIFVITSISDTQSMVMMQAMASGLPVIGVKARALPEYINPKNGILVEPGDYKNLAKKIIFLLKNPGTRRNLSEGARSYAVKFSAPAIAQEWEKIYEKVVRDYNK